MMIMIMIMIMILMYWLYCRFDNLRFINLVKISYCPIPIASVCLCFK